MASSSSIVKFNQEDEHASVVEAFQEFVASYKYSYDALNREAPSSIKEDAAILNWRKKDRRKVFLGKYAHRNLQRLYEDATTEDERENMDFDAMVAIFLARFKLTTNLSLANFKFRQLAQEDNESFEAFGLRVKREAANCDFKCRDQCTVVETLTRDQILFGTRETEVRKNALKEQWNLEDLLKNGKAIEASDKGAAAIKQEPSENIKRTKPGRFSRKSYRKLDDQKRRDNPNKNNLRCKYCSSPRCDGRNCPGKKASCFACGAKGHFRGAEVCKKRFTTKSPKRGRSRRLAEEEDRSERESELSDTEAESEEDDTTETESPSEEEEKKKEGRYTKMKRVYSRVATIRKIGSKRYAHINRTKSRYTVNVIIKETKVPVFCDTGADVCVMNKKKAKKLGLDIMPTTMKIKPYGSRPRRCFGEAVCTIMNNSNVVNATFYIIDRSVETLISGKVSEELGIIKVEKPEDPEVWYTRPVSPSHQVLVRKFPSLFKGVGTLKDYKVKLYVNKDVPPVYQPARPVPFHIRDKLERELKKMEEEDVIEEHHGPAPWVSNTVLAPKDDGGIRVTVDMRCVNKAIRKTNIPIPRPEDISSRMAGYQVFSKLDFRSAFHQLEIEEKSRILTVFHANGRLMRYKRLTMGTTPSSGELNKALRPLFHDIKDAHVIQDDLIIAGRTQEQHDAALEEVCQRIQDSGMTLNPEKCIIASEAIPWWGMVISKEGLSPDPAKVEAMKVMSPPRSRDEVRSLFCMLQSNKNFIPSLAGKTIHIRKLLKKSSRFYWSPKCQEEFNKIRAEFSKDILLRHYDPSLKTEIQVDAHQTGLSAILVQEKNGEKVIVGVASRATTETEARYPQIDLEALAVDFGLRRFRYYIAGGPKILVITDHKPLQSIFKNLRKGSIRTERIKLRHQDIDYEVKWEKGIDNPADYLSRHATPLNMISEEELEETSELEKTVWFLQYSPEALSVERLVKGDKKRSHTQGIEEKPTKRETE